MKRTSMRRVRGVSPSYGRGDSHAVFKAVLQPKYHNIEEGLLGILRQASREQLAKVRLIGAFSNTSFSYADQELSGPQHFSNH